MALSKSLSKRIKITKNGKIVRRRMAVDHFRTSKSTKVNRNSTKLLSLNYPLKKLLSY
ncbi:MAG TPA: 50S ribosomal protein L35 [Candidatus Paceibacterota bacterium]|nr:50S ribosomal protein L35 [Candidatus Paceibacterota bacterium]